MATPLSDEDKRWITEQLTAQAANHAVQLQTQLTAQAANHAVHLQTQLTAQAAIYSDQLHTVETKLLTAFYNWASPNEARQRTHAAALRAVDLEMESLNDRMAKLEGKP